MQKMQENKKRVVTGEVAMNGNGADVNFQCRRKPSKFNRKKYCFFTLIVSLMVFLAKLQWYSLSFRASFSNSKQNEHKIALEKNILKINFKRKRTFFCVLHSTSAIKDRKKLKLKRHCGQNITFKYSFNKLFYNTECTFFLFF